MLHHQSTRFAPVATILILAAFTAPTAAQNPPPPSDFASLAYPARGNIHLDEGTLDLWVISDFDTDFKPSKSPSDLYWTATLFDLTLPDEGWHYPLYFIPWGNALAMVGYCAPSQAYVWGGPPHWKPGEAHHVVWTWSGRKRSIYIDGVCEWPAPKGKNIARDVDVAGSLIGDLTLAEIVVGRGASHLTIDEIQIRSIALTHEEIVAAKGAPLTADVHTLLLDHCDGRPAEVIGGHSADLGETTGKLTGKYAIVDGKFGKAIRLWVPKPAPQ